MFLKSSVSPPQMFVTFTFNFLRVNKRARMSCVVDGYACVITETVVLWLIAILAALQQSRFTSSSS